MNTLVSIEQALETLPRAAKREAAARPAASAEDISPSAWVGIKLSLGFVAFYLVTVSAYLWWGMHQYQDCLPPFR